MTDWEKLICAEPGDKADTACAFLRAYAQGLPIFECFTLAHKLEAHEVLAGEAGAYFLRLQREHAEVLAAVKPKRMEMMDEWSDDGTFNLLRSNDLKMVNEGIKHARARRGLDAPTRVQLTPPDLVRGPIEANTDRSTPLAQRIIEALRDPS